MTATIQIIEYKGDIFLKVILIVTEDRKKNFYNQMDKHILINQ